MESLEPSKVLKFRPNTLFEIRKTYDLHKPGAMAAAVDILEEWLKKQDHFMKKNYDRGYLERSIIQTKGSIERSKKKLDKLCTARSLLPKFFVNDNVQEYTSLRVIEDAILPQLTQDNYRIYILRNTGQDFERELYTNYYRRLVHALEYLAAHDYSSGILMILDYRQTNLMSLLKNLDLVEIQSFINMIIECYSLRIKGMHIVSSSKFIEALVAVFKQVFSAKISKRIYVHKTIDTVYEHVEKDLLPLDYGGKEKTLLEIHKNLLDVAATKEHQEHMKMMNAACTNEAYRPTDKFNEACLGLPGTFRALTVD